MAATIYFSGSISSGRGDVALYRRIVAVLEGAGHRVLAGSVTAEGIGEDGDPMAAEEVFERDLGWISEAGLVVAEVSLPSTGVGYEIAAARYRFGIPVICLWRPAYTKRCSAMVGGDAGVEMIEYSDEGFEGMTTRLLDAIARLGSNSRRE